MLILVINQFVYIRNRQAASEKMSTGHFLPSFRQALTCSKLGNFLFDFRHLDNKKDLKQSFKSYLVQMSKLFLPSFPLIPIDCKFRIFVPTLSGIYFLSNYLLLFYSCIVLFSNSFSYFSFILSIYSVYLYI